MCLFLFCRFGLVGWLFACLFGGLVSVLSFG